MSRFIDLTGKRFNKLTAIKRVKTPENVKGKRTYWLCKCDCGREKIVWGCHLTLGRIKSCGCLLKESKSKQIKDLTGKTFGNLLVIKKVETPENIKGKDIYWLCKCDCGKEKIIRGRNLRGGNTVSCGHYSKEVRKKPFGYSAKRNRYSSYKSDAKKRNIIFSLSFEKFIELTTQNCFYCGSVPSTIEKNKYNNGDFIYNGIDRIDSKKGYIKENVVPSCTKCNLAKGKMDIDDFYSWIEKAYRYNIRSGNIKLK